MILLKKLDKYIVEVMKKSNKSWQKKNTKQVSWIGHLANKRKVQMGQDDQTFRKMQEVLIGRE